MSFERGKACLFKFLLNGQVDMHRGRQDSRSDLVQYRSTPLNLYNDVIKSHHRERARPDDIFRLPWPVLLYLLF